VKSVVNGVVTYYPSAQYQQTVSNGTTTVQKTYVFGSLTVAVSTNGTLNWVLTDQINSTTVTASATGDLNSEIRYTAFGTIRYENGITPTDYRYTGQLQQAVIGLDYYNARWYDPELGRFVQADTVIANANDPASYDRYAYAGNNPISNSDPTGHAFRTVGPCPWCDRDWFNYSSLNSQQKLRITVVASIGCLFIGCHVDINRSAVSGPTTQEWNKFTASLAFTPIAGIGADMVLDDTSEAAESALENATGDIGKGTVKVYRVEGTANTRLNISDSGDVSIIGDKELYLNFGDEQRALDFYQRRLDQGMQDVSLQSFEVDSDFLDQVRQSAVPQSVGKLFPEQPQAVDVTVANDQFGFPSNWFSIIENHMMPGSGRIMRMQ